MQKFQIKKRIQEAIAAHQGGKLVEAAEIYERILKSHPRNVDALHFYGLLHRHLGEDKKALALIENALEIKPDYADALTNYARILIDERRFQDALDAVRKSIDLQSASAPAWKVFGETLARSDSDPKISIEAFQTAVKIEPKDAEAWHKLGIVCWRNGEPERAIEAFKKCVEIGANRWSNPLWHARTLASIDRPIEAIKMLQDYLKDKPDDVIAKHQLSALTGQEVDRVPDDYIKQHFDNFSDGFDEILNGLDYRAPELVAAVVARLQKDQPLLKNVIDLGCGTGLCGCLIHEQCENLIGVDLSMGMLEKAAKHKIYDVLAEGELVRYLDYGVEVELDLAVCVDTLCYFGKLDELMAILKRKLKVGGRLVATVELSPEGVEAPYTLHNAGRYHHTQQYVEEMAREAELVFVSGEKHILRNEAGKPVEGLVFVIESSERITL